MAKSLWTDRETGQDYLLPDDLVLLPGPLVLHGLGAAEVTVKPDDVVCFAVDADTAAAWAKADLSATLAELGQSLKASVLGTGGGTAADGDGADRPGRDLLGAMTGRSGPDMERPGATGRALADYLADLTRTVSDAISDDPDRQAAATERMAEWQATLDKHKPRDEH